LDSIKQLVNYNPKPPGKLLGAYFTRKGEKVMIRKAKRAIETSENLGQLDMAINFCNRVTMRIRDKNVKATASGIFADLTQMKFAELVQKAGRVA
jgi:hypothetical protein